MNNEQVWCIEEVSRSYEIVLLVLELNMCALSSVPQESTLQRNTITKSRVPKLAPKCYVLGGSGK